MGYTSVTVTYDEAASLLDAYIDRTGTAVCNAPMGDVIERRLRGAVVSEN